MTEAVAIAPRQRSSHARDVWRRFRKHRGAMIGAVILGAILLAVIAGPWLWHLDPTAISMRLRNRGRRWIIRSAPTISGAICWRD